MGTHAEVAGCHAGGQVDAGQQPADDDAEEARDTEEDERAARATSDADDQDSAQEQQQGEEGQCGWPAYRLIKIAQLTGEERSRDRLMRALSLSLRQLSGTYMENAHQ